MGRHQKDTLRLVELPNGRFGLIGNIRGKQIRRRGRNYAKLAALYQQLKSPTGAFLGAVEARSQYRETRLTDEELRGAEDLKRAAAGLSFEEIKLLVATHRPPAESLTCEEARDRWLDWQGALHRFPATIANNKRRVTAFLATANVSMLADLTPDHCERYVMRGGISARTQVSDGRAVRAWLTYCVRKRLLRVSPFELDLRDLDARARPKGKPVILTPEQCAALVKATKENGAGDMLPYVALSLFMFLRHGEAKRVTLDNIRMDGEQPVVEVFPRKLGTVSYRVVPIPPNALAMLRTPGGFAVPRIRRKADETKADRDGRQTTAKAEPLRVVYVPQRMLEIRKAAGLLRIKWDHLMRHTGISYRYQQTGDIHKVCREAGNSTDVSFRHYIRLPAAGASAMFYGIRE